MSTPDRPLTRRQLKEMRLTGQVPVVDPDAAADATQQAPGEKPAATQPPKPETANPPAQAPTPEPMQPAAPKPEERDEVRPSAAPASPSKPDPGEQSKPDPGEQLKPAATVSDAPGGRPLTRRQARLQERLRTNSIPVVPPPGADAPQGGDAQDRSAPTDSDMRDAQPASVPTEQPALEEKPAEDAVPKLPVGFTDAMATQSGDAERPAEAPRAQAPETRPADDAAGGRPKVGASFGAAVFQQAEERQRLEREAAEREAQRRREVKAREEAQAPAERQTAEEPAAQAADNPRTATATSDVAPLVDGPDGGEAFAEAFKRSLDAGGSTATGSSLILSDLPGVAPLSAPITATGELLLTSSHTLPDGFASRGAASGTTDGKDVDATLVDGEIPLHSSPAPIAASAAVSTSKAPGDVIRPPAPEKNHGLMLTLGITAGALGVALVGVLIYAFATGVFG